MRRFEIVQSDTDTTTSHSGLALVGRALGLTRLGADLDDNIPLRHGIAHADCIVSYVGIMCTGKSDFDAIENRREDAFFKTSLGIAKVPSGPPPFQWRAISLPTSPADVFSNMTGLA